MRVVLTDLRSMASIGNELRESKERLEEFLAESHDGYWEWSRERKLLLSARLTEILSLGHDAPGEPWSDRAALLRRVHQADAAALKNAITDLITAREDRCDVVVRWALPAGAWKPLRLRGHVVRRTDSGEPAWIAGTVTDLSDQPASRDSRSPRRARDALAAAVIRNFPGGVIALFDARLRYTLIEGSGECERTTRRSLASYVLMGDWGREESRSIESVLRGALAGRTSTTEISVDGAMVEVRAGPVTNADGSITMGVATFHVRSAGPGTPAGAVSDAAEGSPGRHGKRQRRR
jgi:PAS domain-containing protein